MTATAIATYQAINTNDKYRGIRWIANVIATSCGKQATRLKSLKALVDSGKEIGTLDFIMPYEGILVDGTAVCTMPMLDRGEHVPYSNDWYKH